MYRCNSARPHAGHRAPSQHRISSDCSRTERELNCGPRDQNTVDHFRWLSLGSSREVQVPQPVPHEPLRVGLFHELSGSQMADMILFRKTTFTPNHSQRGNYQGGRNPVLTGPDANGTVNPNLWCSQSTLDSQCRWVRHGGVLASSGRRYQHTLWALKFFRGCTARLLTCASSKTPGSTWPVRGQRIYAQIPVREINEEESSTPYLPPSDRRLSDPVKCVGTPPQFQGGGRFGLETRSKSKA